MIICKHGYVLDVDVEGTSKYSQEHELCDCNENRNLYAQIADKYFTVTIYGIDLPWVLDEPFPENSVTRNKKSSLAKIKSLFCGN